jgi:hypothetical protein
MKRLSVTWLLVIIATLIPSLSRASVMVDPIYVGTLVSTGDPQYVGTLTTTGAPTNPVPVILGTPTPATTTDPATAPQSPATSPSTYGFVTQPSPSSFSAYVIAPSTTAPADNSLGIQLGAAVPTATYTAGAGSASPSLYDTSLSGATLMGAQSSVPEPATLALLGSGLVLAGMRFRRRSKRQAD